MPFTVDRGELAPPKAVKAKRRLIQSSAMQLPIGKASTTANLRPR